MRDKTKAARAVLRSEIYRGSHRTSGPGALEADATPPRPAEGTDTPKPRRRGAAGSQLTALALLGLLDLFKGG